MLRRVKTLAGALAALGLAALVPSCRAGGAADMATAPFPEARVEVERALAELLRAAERKNFPLLESMHLYGPKFSKWAGSGAVRLDAETTRRAERAGIEAIEAMKFSVEDLKVDVFGPAAVATFVMVHEAVAGGQTSTTRARATLVWVETESGWKVAHEHFSPAAAAR
jgi:hypothetical protein